jgi:hypothetical protein
MVFPVVPPKLLPTVPKKASEAFQNSFAPAPEPLVEIVDRRPKKGSSKLQPWMVNAFAAAMKKGHTVASASDVIGVSARTVSRWLAEAENEDCKDDLLLEFAHAARSGRASVTGTLIEACMAHAITDPKIAFELLKVHQKDFNTAKKIEAEVTPMPVKRDLSSLSDEEVEFMQAIERKMLTAGEG